MFWSSGAVLAEIDSGSAVKLTSINICSILWTQCLCFGITDLVIYACVVRCQIRVDTVFLYTAASRDAVGCLVCSLPVDGKPVGVVVATTALQLKQCK